jgi:adenylate cyclase
LAAFYYNAAATNAESTLEKERAKLEELTVLLRKMFGRYLSIEVMNSLIENPSTLELGGEKRSVTIMISDLRGFTALSERLKPEQVVQMLNNYFELMVEVILKYNGTINEIIGDALLIIFGAPQEMPDRSQRAIACAIEMQNKMAEVNERNRSEGLPELEMGIGLNETEVIVGNIGSAKRSKYAAVGSGVNITNRIESYTVGGQIYISESVRQKAGEVLRIDDQREVLPKGSETPLKIYEVGGIAGDFSLVLEKKEPAMVTLVRQLPILYTVLDGKDLANKGGLASVMELSKNCANIAFSGEVEVLSNVKMNLVDAGKNLAARDFYGKVTKSSRDNLHIHEVHFTSVPPEVDSYFQALQKYASKQVVI